LNGFIVPNGLAFSPDGRTMYLSDSHPAGAADLGLRLRHRQRHAANRRLFVDMHTTSAAPMAPRSMPMAATGSAPTTPG
jgi:sugar lactone lactonase YvrE